jgi:hypothetical protein
MQRRQSRLMPPDLGKSTELHETLGVNIYSLIGM